MATMRRYAVAPSCGMREYAGARYAGWKPQNVRDFGTAGRLTLGVAGRRNCWTAAATGGEAPGWVRIRVSRQPYLVRRRVPASRTALRARDGVPRCESRRLPARILLSAPAQQQPLGAPACILSCRKRLRGEHGLSNRADVICSASCSTVRRSVGLSPLKIISEWTRTARAMMASMVSSLFSTRSIFLAVCSARNSSIGLPRREVRVTLGHGRSRVFPYAHEGIGASARGALTRWPSRSLAACPGAA